MIHGSAGCTGIIAAGICSPSGQASENKPSWRKVKWEPAPHMAGTGGRERGEVLYIFKQTDLTVTITRTAPRGCC